MTSLSFTEIKLELEKNKTELEVLLTFSEISFTIKSLGVFSIVR